MAILDKFSKPRIPILHVLSKFELGSGLLKVKVIPSLEII
jgi:hypothetical protein